MNNDLTLRYGNYSAKGLTRTNADAIEERVFRLIVQFKRENDGCAPSIREIGERMGWDSTSYTLFYLKRLEGHGRIMLSGNGSARRIRVVGGQWSMRGERR